MDTVEMAHTNQGQMEVLKKKELILVAHAMSQEEFNKLVTDCQNVINLPISDHLPANEIIVAMVPVKVWIWWVVHSAEFSSLSGVDGEWTDKVARSLHE